MEKGILNLAFEFKFKLSSPSGIAKQHDQPYMQFVDFVYILYAKCSIE
jgi:hypothetical protein